MKRLYPELEPTQIHCIEVGTPHVVHAEECGATDGIPVVFIHGGPGSGCSDYHRRFFDPERYRIILFDQRGSGRSTPKGEITANTTQDLVEDMERIRKRLNIEKWLLFGGSWGAALAFVYAMTHPQRVLGMILRGTFLASQASLDWFLGEGGVKRIFPDAWEAFIATIPPGERGDLVAACYRRIILSDDRSERVSVARAWSNWADRIVTFSLPPSEISNQTGDVDALLAKTSIEAHYAYHRYFLNDNFILENIDHLPQVPVTIVHGRRDLTCTLDAAWALHRAIAQSELIIVPDAGHLASEPTMIDALVTVTDDMKAMF